MSRFPLPVERKIECTYVFGGPYLSFIDIVWGKSLSFWWSVPSFLIAFLTIDFFVFVFSFFFVCDFIISGKKKKVKHKMKKF